MKVFIAIIIATSFFFLPSCERKDAPLPTVGNKAPSFTLKGIDGKKVSLSDFSGRVTVLDFWATWCSPCKESTRELERLHEKYKDKGVAILGVSMDAGGNAVQKVKDFAEKYNLTYPMVMDDGKASVSYGVTKIPATYVLDKDHTVARIYPGYIPGLGDRIAEQVELLLR